ALGNTGRVAEAAACGAAAGIALAASGTIAWRALGGAAALAFLLYAARAPVLAGGLALGAAWLAFALLDRGLLPRARGLHAALAALALLVTLGAALLPRGEPAGAGEGRSDPARAAPEPTGPARTAPAHTGGIEVRARVWHSSLGMLLDRPWLGAGPGQFAASFPP